MSRGFAAEVVSITTSPIVADCCTGTEEDSDVFGYSIYTVRLIRLPYSVPDLRCCITVVHGKSSNMISSGRSMSNEPSCPVNAS